MDRGASTAQDEFWAGSFDLQRDSFAKMAGGRLLRDVLRRKRIRGFDRWLIACRALSGRFPSPRARTKRPEVDRPGDTGGAAAAFRREQASRLRPTTICSTLKACAGHHAETADRRA